MGAQQAILATDDATPESRISVADHAPSASLCLLVTDGGDGDSAIELSEEAIRQRSEQIWEREGRPEGYAEDHWRRARAELAALMARTSNSQLAPGPADEAAPSACTLVPQAPLGTADSDTQPEVLDGVSEPQTLVLQDAVISPPQDEPVAAIPRPLRIPPQRLPQSAVVPSIVCAGIVLRGSLDSPGDVQFDGTMEGDICCVGITVGVAAVIQGDVVADEVLVRGRIKGRICARRVHLYACACVDGDIHYGTLVFEDGAQLSGSFEQVDDLCLSAPAVHDTAFGPGRSAARQR